MKRAARPLAPSGSRTISPRQKRWHGNARQAWQRGETETLTLTGRRRINVERLTDRLNAPVQDTGADALNLALALLWERRNQRPGVMPILVCRDEVVVECDAEQAVDVRAWLEKAMVKGMDVVLNNADEVRTPVEIDTRIARSWVGS
jgi:DNA polymerase I-like protein with 3'-5' exonuclease and polymerase domains